MREWNGGGEEEEGRGKERAREERKRIKRDEGGKEISMTLSGPLGGIPLARCLPPPPPPLEIY